MKNVNETELERWFIAADELIMEGQVPEAKEALYEILRVEPGYGKAHAHLGWIFTHVIVDLEKAQEHYELALKFTVGFPVLFTNFAIFLLEANRYTDVVEKTLEFEKVIGADIAFLMCLRANALEVLGRRKESMRLYKEAKNKALGTEFIHQVNTHIDRLHLKMGKLEKVLLAF